MSLNTGSRVLRACIVVVSLFHTRVQRQGYYHDKDKKRKDVLSRRAFRCLNSELNLTIIFEKSWFLPGLFRHRPSLLEERERESERFYRGKIDFSSREEGVAEMKRSHFEKSPTRSAEKALVD